MPRFPKLACAAFAAAAIAAVAVPAHAAVEGATPPSVDWPFEGIFGRFDRAALQRGLQVYVETCKACHGLQYLAYRDLVHLGYDGDQISAIAEQFEIEDGPDERGDMFFRPALPSDRFVPPYPNDRAAMAANMGALPPDLSLIYKARIGGADYLAALLTGYDDPPPDFELQDGLHYNPYYPGHQIAMPQILFEGAVSYADGTPATPEQMARDVTTFLAWAAEPHLERRKSIGISVMLFLFVLTGLLYATKRKIWRDAHQ